MRQQRIVIVGAGIVGLSTAYALLNQGVKHVTVLEQETVDHRRSTSHGMSRLLRFEYGSDLFYSQMVQMSLSRWKQLERTTKRVLYTPTGLLVLGAEGDGFSHASYHVMQEMALPVERLSKQCCKERFPQFDVRNSDIITYNSEAGILHASTCLQTLRDLTLDLGGDIYESCRVTHLSHDNPSRPVSIHTSTGHELPADRVVLAAGPWVHRLLADLDLPVRMTRQYLLYFAGLPVSAYSVNAFPAFMINDLYGFPMRSSRSHDYGSYWLKAARHAFGTPVDPDDIFPAEWGVIDHAVQELCEVIPALKLARLAQVDTCMYDVSPDEDFILDRLPDDPRVVFASGLSGHGFKFGLLLGELLGSMVCNSAPPVALTRFQLARFSQRAISVA